MEYFQQKGIFMGEVRLYNWNVNNTTNEQVLAELYMCFAQYIFFPGQFLSNAQGIQPKSQEE